MVFEINEITMGKIVDVCLSSNMNNDSDDGSIDTECSEDSYENESIYEELQQTLSSCTSELLLSPTIITTKGTSTTCNPSVDFKNSFANSPCVRKVLTGVIVNGFHPQLCNWKEKSRTSNSVDATTTQNDIPTATIVSKRRRLSSSIEEHITEQVSSARSQTAEEMSGTITQWGKTELKFLTSSVSSQDEKSTAFQIYSDVFENSNVAQLIAAPGGRIAACKLDTCLFHNLLVPLFSSYRKIELTPTPHAVDLFGRIGNQEFSNLFSSYVDTSKPTLNTLTAFDVVEPTMIPKLYEIFLVALQGDLVKQHEQNIDGKNDDDVRYISLCVPCIRDFGGEEEQYYITVSTKTIVNQDRFCFMNSIS